MSGEKKEEWFLVLNPGLTSLDMWFKDAKRMSDIVSIYVRLSTITAVTTLTLIYATKQSGLILYAHSIAGCALVVTWLAYAIFTWGFTWKFAHMMCHNILARGYLPPIQPGDLVEANIREDGEESSEKKTLKDQWLEVYALWADLALDVAIITFTGVITVAVMLSCSVLGVSAGSALAKGWAS